MQSDIPPKSNWLPLPPQRNTDLARRIGWLNILFSIFYLFHFVRWFLVIILKDPSALVVIPTYIEVIADLTCFACILTGGVFLLKGRVHGKRLTKYAGIAGAVAICLIGVWALTLFGVAPYDKYPLSVLGNFVKLVIRYTFQFAYPMIAGFILTRNSDKYLGLD
ncbi:MAG: hypothetical protein AB1607_11120 [Chloroflexota bacterium]